MLLLTENCLQYQKRCLYKGRSGWFPSAPICVNKVQPVPIKAILQPAKAAILCTACLEYARPPPPIPPFLLVQTLSSKGIVQIDNVQPKSDDAKWHYRWLTLYPPMMQFGIV